MRGMGKQDMRMQVRLLYGVHNMCSYDIWKIFSHIEIFKFLMGPNRDPANWIYTTLGRMLDCSFKKLHPCVFENIYVKTFVLTQGNIAARFSFHINHYRKNVVV